jgi:amidohydrolase
MESYVINLRRELHAHAEIGFDLPQTLAILRRELDALGVAYTEEYGKSSIVATINPEKSHFTLAVRAAMDALPIEEANDVPYRSCNEGAMHACGHDAHTAIAMATLRRVWEMRDQIACCVKFLFQPAEEYAPSGAMLMAKDGVMEDIDCIVGMHVDSTIPVGNLAITPGPQNATSDGFMLDFYGKSAHAARQHMGVDAIVMAMRALMDIELVVAKEIHPKKPVVFNVGAIHGGSANNIICDHCSMFCTLRTWDGDVAEHILDKAKRIAEAVASTAGGSATFTPKKHYPIVMNNEKLTERFRASAVNVVGEEHMRANERGMGGEDFAYFAKEKPGAFMRLGIRNEEKGITVGVHNEHFEIDESALAIGVDVFTQFILDNQNGIEF